MSKRTRRTNNVAADDLAAMDALAGQDEVNVSAVLAEDADMPAGQDEDGPADEDGTAVADAVDAVEPDLSDEERTARIEAVRTRLSVLRAEVAALEGELATYQTHILVTSTVVKPVALVRSIFLAMTDKPRRDVIRKCVLAGIAPNTAKTQYQVLRRKLADRDPSLLADLADLSGEE